MGRLGKDQGGDAGRSLVVKVRMQPELWAAVQARASELGVGASTLVRDLVDLGLTWSSGRIQEKLRLLHDIVAQEPALDEIIERHGGDPGEAGR